MRHRKKFNHLSRTAPHRRAMLSNMATSLIMHKRITTTLAKAKALRVYIEPIITRSKSDTTHSRRMVFSYLQSKEAVTELFRDISSKVADRPGGYTRIIKLGNRLGDNADMAMIELVDYNLNLLGEKTTAKAKTTRRGRRGAGKKGEEEGAFNKVDKEKDLPEKEAAEVAAPEVPAVEDTAAEVAEAVVEAEVVAEAEAEVVAEAVDEVEEVAEAVAEAEAEVVAEAEIPESEEKTESEEETQSEEETKA